MTMRIFYIFFIYEPQKKPQVGTGTGKFTFTGNKLLIIQYYFSCLACTQRGMDPFQISSDGWHAEQYLRYYSSTTGTRQKYFLRKNGLGNSRCCVCSDEWMFCCFCRSAVIQDMFVLPSCCIYQCCGAEPFFLGSGAR